MEVIRVLYYKNNEECGCEFFNKDSNIKEIENMAEENKNRYKTYSKIEIIEVKYLVIYNSSCRSWVYFFKEDEYNKALSFYKDNLEGIDKEDILEIVIL